MLPRSFILYKCPPSADGLSFARKAMIICGLSLNRNGHWEKPQLRLKLQCIISKRRKHFDGEAVPEEPLYVVGAEVMLFGFLFYCLSTLRVAQRVNLWCVWDYFGAPCTE